MKRAVFLDRDGTIIRDTHYIHRTDDLTFVPGVVESLHLLKELGLLFA